MGLYGGSFGLYLWLIRQNLSDRHVFYVGVLVRVLVLFALPRLSDDVYRFLWDGRLLVGGADPFALRPSEWLAMSHPPQGINQELHRLIYADNYTVYPPIHQFVFWLSAKASMSIRSGILVLKSVLVLGEVSLLWFLRKLQRIGWWPQLFFVYALNPLVVLEISGNGHFEGLLVLFLVLGLYGLRQKNFMKAGLGFGLGIGTKLLPLMILPLLWRYLSGQGNSKKMFFQVFGWIFGINLVLWLPFLWLGSLGHLMDSVWLYFESFEFNASIYYVLKWLAPEGWRIGLLTNGLTVMLVVFLAFRQKPRLLSGLVENMSLIWWVYLLDSAIVHPWYVIPVLVLSTMSDKSYGLVWSGLIYLSYSHYWGGNMEEHYGIIALEYILMLGMARYFAQAQKRASPMV